MEMPVDILNHRLGNIRDNGDTYFDHAAIAIDIDQELQEKFIFIPQEEIEAVEIEAPTASAYTWTAGSGPETIRASANDNPAWLYNSAVHALAMYQHLTALQEQEALIKKLAKRPEPGLYQGKATDYFTVIVTNDRRVLVQQSMGGLRDSTDIWDGMTKDGATMHWTLQRIDLTDGTISA